MAESTASVTPRGWGLCCLLILMTGIVYARVLTADFINYDDPTYIWQNPLVRGGITPTGLWQGLTTIQASNWHPLTWWSLMLDAQIWGVSPFGFHLTNLLLHMANVVLIYWLFWRMTLHRGASFLIAGLFAIHPAHVESVAWITERKDVLSLCCGLLAVHQYLTWAFRPGLLQMLAVGFWLALSLMAKPLFVTAPCLLILLDYWPLRRSRSLNSTELVNFSDAREQLTAPAAGVKSLSGLIIEKWLLWLIVAGSVVMTLIAQSAGGAVRSLETFSAADRARNIIVSYVRYLGKAAWPDQLGVIYPFHENRWSWGATGAALAVLVGITWLAFRVRRTRPAVWIGWLWFLGTLLPMIGVIHVGAHAMADRYLYLPILGLWLAVVVGVIGPWCGNRPVRWGLLAAMWLVPLGNRTTMYVECWQNSERLARCTLAATTDNYIAHFLLAHALEGRCQQQPEIRAEVEGHYRRVLKFRPGYSQARNNLALQFVAWGRTEEAVQEYLQGLKLDSTAVNLRMNLANLLARQGEYREAIEHYQQIQVSSPQDRFGIARNHGLACEGAGDYPAAITLLEEALRISPRDLLSQIGLVRARSRQAFISGDPQGLDARTGAALVRRAEAEGNTELLPHAKLAHGLSLLAIGERDAGRLVLEELVRQETRRGPTSSQTSGSPLAQATELIADLHRLPERKRP